MPAGLGAGGKKSYASYQREGLGRRRWTRLARGQRGREGTRARNAVTGPLVPLDVIWPMSGPLPLDAGALSSRAEP